MFPTSGTSFTLVFLFSYFQISSLDDSPFDNQFFTVEEKWTDDNSDSGVESTLREGERGGCGWFGAVLGRGVLNMGDGVLERMHLPT